MRFFSKEELLLIIFGWGLGIMGTLGVDLIRNLLRTWKLTKIVLNDLHDLQVRLASTWWLLKKNKSKKEVLWAIKMIEGYEGSVLEPGFREKLESHPFLKTGEDAIMAENLGGFPQNQIRGLRKYYLHSLQTGGGGLIDLKPRFSREVTEILNRLEMYNELVVEQKRFLDQTFDGSISPENHEIICKNLDGVHDSIIDICYSFAQLVEGVRNKHG